MDGKGRGLLRLGLVLLLVQGVLCSPLSFAELYEDPLALAPGCDSLASRPPGEAAIFPPKATPRFKQLITTWRTLATFCNQLERTTEDLIAYHWSNLPNCIRWGIQRRIPEAEMDLLTDPYSMMEITAGVGYYMAVEPSSSAEFGVCAAVVRIPAGTLLYNHALASSLFSFSSRADATKVYLGRLVV